MGWTTHSRADAGIGEHSISHGRPRPPSSPRRLPIIGQLSRSPSRLAMERQWWNMIQILSSAGNHDIEAQPQSNQRNEYSSTHPYMWQITGTTNCVWSSPDGTEGSYSKSQPEVDLLLMDALDLAAMAADVTCFLYVESRSTVREAELLPESGLPAQDLSPWFYALAPSFRPWVANLLRCTGLSKQDVIHALSMVSLLRHRDQWLMYSGDHFRIFLIALILSNKYLHDDRYTNDEWADILQITVAEITNSEIEFLQTINYKLYHSEREWWWWSYRLKKLCVYITKVNSLKNPGRGLGW